MTSLQEKIDGMPMQRDLPRLVIQGNANGSVTVSGPLNHPKGKLICMELIAKAIMAVMQYDERKVVVPGLVPPRTIPRNDA